MENNIKHSASDVAKWFLAHNRIKADDEGADLISNLKLQKLLYYAQGCFLAINGKPLFGDDILAWKHGPVVEKVYHEYKQYGANGIEFTDDFNFDDFTKEENELLEEVYKTFAQYSAWKLRDMTHEEKPWNETPPNGVISNELIRKFFQQEYVE